MSIVQKFSIADVIEAYVRAHTDRSISISMADALRSVRLAVPQNGMTNSELTNAIARIAMMNGRCIFFDGGRDEQAS